MALALVLFNQWSNALLILLSAVILIYLLRTIHVRDKLWMAGFICTLLIGIISSAHIVAYQSLAEQLKSQESALEEMKSKYESLKAETATARESYNETRIGVTSSKDDLAALKHRLNAEFDKAVRDIRAVYAGISDEELDRRVNDAVRKARQNLQHNVFH